MLTITAKQIMPDKTVTIHIEPTATVTAFVDVVADRLGFAQASHMKIIKAGGILNVSTSDVLHSAGFMDGDIIHVLANYRGPGGMNFTEPADPATEMRVQNKRKESEMAMCPLMGSKIYAVQRDGGGDRQEALALQFSPNVEDVIYAGGGPDHFKLDAGGGLRVQGADSFDALVGKKIESIQYREWRKSGPGPSAKKRADKRGGDDSVLKTGAVLFIEGDMKVYSVKTKDGSEPASMTYIYADGDEGGALETGLPAD